MTQSVNFTHPTGGSNARLVDYDPISPGIQSRPGVVRPVGPPQIVGNAPVGMRPPVYANSPKPVYR